MQDYFLDFLDHDHSAYVDQWDWGLAIHLGEVSVTVWPRVLKEICARATSTSSSSRLPPVLRHPAEDEGPRPWRQNARLNSAAGAAC